MPATTSPTTATSTRSSAPSPTSTTCSPRRTPRHPLIVDLVPNHSSDQHVWFQEALAAGPGSRERARYLFRDGKGEEGELPPNNWESVFGGPAWTRVVEADGTPGQWYLHLFDSSQPDFDWSNEEVREEFRRILRFWLDRGVDGFRVDVAHGLVKQDGLPDYVPPTDAGSMGGGESDVPYWGRDGVHEIYRDWHRLLAEYDGDRALCAEAWLPTPEQTGAVGASRRDAPGVQLRLPRDRMGCRRPPRRHHRVARAYAAVGAPSTWVLSNHDVVRHASRLALTAENPQGHGIGPDSAGKPIPEVGLRRARAATTLMLALPGSSYLYQGEELGLPEVIELADDVRQDPTWFRTAGERYGRDGCRVPLPWTASAPAYGFSPTGAAWLPQPEQWAALARDVQSADPASTLSLYRDAARAAPRPRPRRRDADLDRRLPAGRRRIPQRECDGRREPRRPRRSPLPSGTVIAASGPVTGGELPVDTTVWLDGRLRSDRRGRMTRGGRRGQHR